MITISDIAAQGDVLFRRIGRLPDDAVEQSSEGRIVVAHSETGHDHAIDDPEVRLFERLVRDPMVCFLSVDGEHADVVHHRAHHTHAPLRLTRGLWEVRRQREWTPEGFLSVQD
ncbi:MAG TPA: hypothetical protein VIF57_20660 [Polyangia bacterium]|jgi:hypothetical protein